uniref:NADH-ubiquinone oxidoreductase chain 6 n=1 Tax=Panulirus longipes TaxID=59761 RepID=A0A7G9M8L1_PANLO|nr:NADH dehydrogenase subunit 6 [Panulirus longipes]QNN01848.1 NADH dehydrogenase subunit 6 [Panulirus longipes]
MTIFFVPFILSFSIVFTRLTHPLSAGIMLLIQTTLISISSGMISPSFWFSYILFLIFLGGMLVLFIYVASLASNESFKLSLFLTGMILLGSFFLSTLFMFLDPLFSIQPVSVQHSFFSAKDIPDLSSVSTHFIYNFPTMGLTLVVILYLLFTLIVVVEMTSVFSGPLRLSK